MRFNIINMSLYFLLCYIYTLLKQFHSITLFVYNKRNKFRKPKCFRRSDITFINLDTENLVTLEIFPKVDHNKNLKTLN